MKRTRQQTISPIDASVYVERELPSDAAHRDLDGLDASYNKFIEAYDRMFDRFGLEWYRVESDVGMMGGLGAH